MPHRGCHWDPAHSPRTTARSPAAAAAAAACLQRAHRGRVVVVVAAVGEGLQLSLGRVVGVGVAVVAGRLVPLPQLQSVLLVLHLQS